MTEAEWVAAEHPRRMLEFLGGRVTDRKRRLFAIARARRTNVLWGDHRPQDVPAEAERLADDTAAEVNRWGCGRGAAEHFTRAAVVSTVAPDPLAVSDLSASRAAVSLGRAASEPFPHHHDRRNRHREDLGYTYRDRVAVETTASLNPAQTQQIPAGEAAVPRRQ